MAMISHRYRDQSRTMILQQCLILVALIVCLSGCNNTSDLGQITGTVTMNEKPITGGTILFEDRKRGISVRANLDKDGQYHLRTHDSDGLPPGAYQIAISSTRIGSGESPFVGGKEERAAPAPFSDIPPKYQKVATSGLVAEIEKGENVKDFALD